MHNLMPQDVCLNRRKGPQIITVAVGRRQEEFRTVQWPHMALLGASFSIFLRWELDMHQFQNRFTVKSNPPLVILNPNNMWIPRFWPNLLYQALPRLESYIDLGADMHKIVFFLKQKTKLRLCLYHIGLLY